MSTDKRNPIDVELWDTTPYRPRYGVYLGECCHCHGARLILVGSRDGRKSYLCQTCLRTSVSPISVAHKIGVTFLSWDEEHLCKGIAR